MFPRKLIIQSLEASISKTIEKIEELTTACQKHDLRSRPEADACPCQAELYWKLDRLDESIYRLKKLNHSVGRWYPWYLQSSSKNPTFPKASIQAWSQTGQPIAAWQKYGVAQKMVLCDWIDNLSTHNDCVLDVD